ncbi:hypothetical protein AB6Q13_19015 [Ralstonia solanacearum]|uniref:hypothetical protein n=1 Tax=Ralstonia solanacearum TaxID=305 RepID=UPI0023056025|nr:hypothetical protein [Ralstonia solanacearum]MDB0564652.1 hypothetical protein [Ralstonia solanacearum]MDB0577154.1 hypothetical protein [Ralstonia solanacearum]
MSAEPFDLWRAWQCVMAVGVAVALLVSVPGWLSACGDRLLRRRLAAFGREAWLGYLRRERDELLTALAHRDEAYIALDGEGLEVADALARHALDRLGGLAGSW